MAHFFFPGSIGSTSPLFAILLLIISDPASPKPSARSVPIFMIAFSINNVSSYSSPSYFSKANSFAFSGSYAILFTLSIILSIGCKANSLASFENKSAPTISTTQINRVLPKLSPAALIELLR